MQRRTYANNRFDYDLVKNRRKYTGVHYHDDYEFYYMINGTTKFFIGDEIFQVGSGNFVIISPGTYHMTDSEDCLHNERILISFSRQSVNEKIHNVLDTLCQRRVINIPSAKLAEAEQIISNIEKEYQTNDENSEFLINLYIDELLVQLYRFCRRYKPHMTESDRLIHDVSQYIRTNYASDISLQALCKKFAMSESHLSRQFKTVSGIGINEYITYVRILNAENLLKTTTLPITEVAELSGFNDSNYFSTVFKRIKGITPLKFSHRFRQLQEWS